MDQGVPEGGREPIGAVVVRWRTMQWMIRAGCFASRDSHVTLYKRLYDSSFGGMKKDQKLFEEMHCHVIHFFYMVS